MNVMRGKCSCGFYVVDVSDEQKVHVRKEVEKNTRKAKPPELRQHLSIFVFI